MSLSRDGLIVVKKQIPFEPARELIVVPRAIVPGLLTALHLRLHHPVKSQLSKVFNRYFYALDSERYIQSVTSSCSQCAAVARLPKEVVEFSTSQDPPTSPGSHFACDVLCRAKQKILVLRDCFSSYTKAKIIPREDKSTIRDSLIELTADIKVTCCVVIRVDGSSSMQSLVGDDLLARHGLLLEVGRLKNINKNPVGEKAIQELEAEIRKELPEGGPITTSVLAVMCQVLNSRIRNRGLSAREILYQRDNETMSQLHISDQRLAEQQMRNRQSNHLPSAISKAPTGIPPHSPVFKPGDLVFVKGDGSKHTGRDRYLVSSCDENFVHIKKLVGFQYRAREYKVKPSEIFCVPFSDIPRAAPYETDSSSSDSSEDEASEHGGPAAEPMIASLAGSDNDLDSSIDNFAPLPSSSDNESSRSGSEGEPDTDTVPARRPRSLPVWMQSGDWHIG